MRLRSAAPNHHLHWTLALTLHGVLAHGAPPIEPPAPSAGPVVASVEVLQNRFLQSETLLFYISTKPGDLYDEHRLRDDFRRVWETGFLDDLVLDVQDGPKGKLVRFVVQERKRVVVVDFRGHRAISTTDIEDELKKKDAAVRVDSFYDPARARRVEQLVRELLVAKGRPFATVRHDAKPLASGVQVSFIVDEGVKALVKAVSFTGNQVFSDAQLRRQMKKIQPKGLRNLSFLKGTATYTPEKWSGPEGDEQRLRDYLLDNGHVVATVGEPVTTYEDGRSGWFRKRPVKWVRLEIPITEGEAYRVGKVAFEGLTVFNEAAVRGMFRLQTGDLYRESRLRKGYDSLRDLYGARGYFQWTGTTRRSPDPDRKVVDLTLAMEEDQKYYVGRITFTGNNTTRDKVIRREVYLNEGDVFNTEALKLSIRRLNQIGYFKPMEEAPDLRPNSRGQDQLDVTFKLSEQNRNQFTFGGGVSGLEGAFLNASFQTANFLGLGETVSLAAQQGGRSTLYQLSVSEPYLFDRPITAGIDLFTRRTDYLAGDGRLGYSQARSGVSLVAGLPLARFTRAFSNYTYEVIDTAIRDDLVSTTSASSSSSPNFDVFADAGRSYESRVSPQVVHNTVDSIDRPRRGLRITSGLQVAGGVLGGSVDYLRPELEAVLYVPHTRRTALGVRGQVGYIRPFGDTTRLPYYQRYFLGGETQVRGYDARTVSPLDSDNRALGGNKFLLFNAEYYVDVFGPLRFLLFFDAGEAYSEGSPVYWKTMRTSTGAELRFQMPVLNVPLRLIYAINPNRDWFQPQRAFKFAVGTTF